MERRQSQRDMRICIADAQSRGVRGHAPPPEIFFKIDQNLCNLVRFLTHLSNFYKSTESTFYSWKLFTHENRGNTVWEKRKSAERRNNYRLCFLLLDAVAIILLAPLHAVHSCQSPLKSSWWVFIFSEWQYNFPSYANKWGHFQDNMPKHHTNNGSIPRITMNWWRESIDITIINRLFHPLQCHL